MSNGKEQKFISLAEFKTFAESAGGFRGYANNFGVLDSYDDISLPGCFADSLTEFVETGFSVADHDWGIGSEIGFIQSASEDETGLFVEVAYHPTEDAQNIRQKINSRLDNHKKVSLSIGYRVMSDGYQYIRGEECLPFIKNPDQKTLQYLKEAEPIVRLLTKIKVFEVSPVSVGANSASQIVDSKSIQAARRRSAGGNTKAIELLKLRLRAISVAG